MRGNLCFGNTEKHMKEEPFVLCFRQSSAQKKKNIMQTAVQIIRLRFFQKLLFRARCK